jgi:hypothetical protein
VGCRSYRSIHSNKHINKIKAWRIKTNDALQIKHQPMYVHKLQQFRVPKGTSLLVTCPADFGEERNVGLPSWLWHLCTTRAAELSAQRARRNSTHGNSLVLLNSDRRISLRENFHGLHPDSKPGATVLWRNEWTNCAKARTVPKSIKAYSVWQEVSNYFSCAQRYKAGLSDKE